MEENLAWLVAVVTAYFAHTILSRTIRAQHDVPLLNSFGDRPQSSTCQPSSDFRLVRVRRQVNGNELPIEGSPFFWQLVGQVLIDAEVGSQPGSSCQTWSDTATARKSMLGMGRLDAARLAYRSGLYRENSTQLARISTSAIASRIGVSRWYAGRIREDYRPHPRHWEALAQLVGVSAAKPGESIVDHNFKRR